MNSTKTLMVSQKNLNVENWSAGLVSAVGLDPSTAGCDVMECVGVININLLLQL